MLVFWKKGYEATSIPDLLEAMEISRSSLYETFTDKQTLYLEAIERYKKIGEAKRNLLLHASSAKIGIRQYFERHIEFSYDEQLPGGCMFTNAAIDLDEPDRRIHQLVRDRFEELEQAFYELLRKGQQTGEIDASKNVRSLAHLLLNLNHSINVVSKVSSDKKAAYDMMNVLIEML